MGKLGYCFILLLAFGVFVFVFWNVGFDFGGDWMTGEVVAFYSPSGCDDSEISQAWDDIFVESSSGANFFINDSLVNGTCADFIGYKVSGDEVWVMSFRRSGDAYGRISGSYWGAYMNASPEFVSVVEGVDAFSEANVELLSEGVSNVDYVNNRSSPLLIGGASEEFPGKFSVDEGAWEADGEDFRFEVVEDLDNFTSIGTGVVSAGEDVTTYYYFYVDASGYVAPEVPVLTGNVSDFVFEWNSDWNVAFDVDEYFTYPEGSVFDFSYVGVNNSDGVWIDYDVVGDEVRFRPVAGFLGARNFKVSVVSPVLVSVVSNSFEVNIVEHINRVPWLVTDIGSIALTGGSSFILDLEYYFSDPDGDNLTYRVSSPDDIVMSLDGDELTVELGANFSIYGYFRVYASDGFLEKVSNKIWVYDSLSGVDFSDVVNDSVNRSVNGSVNGSLSGPENGSIDGASQQEEGLGRWVWIFLIVVLVLGGVGLVVYFLVLKKGVPVVEATSVPTSSVDDYLKKLDLAGK